MSCPYVLYIATNTVNGMQYVGLSSEYGKRLVHHKSAKSKSIFHKAIKDYGFDAFVFSEIASAVDLPSACAIERMLIAQHNTLKPFGYNMTIGGQVGPVGLKHTAETKAKISKANADRPIEMQITFANFQKGKMRTDAFKANASAKMKEIWAARKLTTQALAFISNKEHFHD